MKSIWDQNYLIDTHCHVLASQGYEDIDKEFENIKKSKVQKIILIGCSTEEAKETIELARKYPGFVYPSIGIHPEETFKDSFNFDNQVSELEALIKENKDILVAVGECGFEYFYLKNVLQNNPDKDENEMKALQRKLFETQVQFAKQYELPLIVHCRDAWEDNFEILEKYQLPMREWKDLPLECAGIMHSFTSTYDNAKKSIELNFKLGINGIITFKNGGDLRAAIKKIITELGKEPIVYETDAPYLTPEPHRGKRNSPVYIEEIDKYFSTSMFQ